MEQLQKISAEWLEAVYTVEARKMRTFRAGRS